MASIVSAGTTSATALNMSADTSGVLQLASNNGTVALTVTTAQYIGVGTTTPGVALEVWGNQSYAGKITQLILKDTTAMAVDTGAYMQFSGNYTTAGDQAVYGGIGAFKENSTSGQYGGYVAITTRTNGSLPAERFRLNSAGLMTVPYQPCFSARQTSTGLTTADAAEQKFDVVLFNTGSYYNASTGRFTAPVAGKYLFRFQMLTVSTSGRALCYIAKNNSQSIPSVEASATALNYNDIHAMAIFDLSAGDYVSIKNATTAEALFYGSPSNQNWFVGYLIC
jgi:hypothetical protein